MINIQIEDKLKDRCPKLKLGIILCDVEVHENCPELWDEINEYIKIKELELTSEKIREISTVDSSKNAYRALGKDPNRYRLSSEALLRRIANGKGLYKINNVVDLLNFVSIASGFSIGGYNADKIEGTVLFGIGIENEEYQGIGRGELNIQNLPVFRDKKGAFGSPTSDSVRTSITTECKKFLMIIISFQNENGLQQSMDHAVNLLETYAQAENIEMKLI